MADCDPFRVMCDMWGIETAVEKAKKFGIDISQKEIDAQCQKDKKALDASISYIKSMKKRVVPIDE